MKRTEILIYCLLFLMVGAVFSLSACSKPAMSDDFSFSLVWNTYGESFYDSATGELIKTTNATNPDEYVTELFLSETQIGRIFEIISELDLDLYPEDYDPKNGELSSPSQTLILTIRNGTTQVISCRDIAMGYDSKDRNGQKLLKACEEIINIICSTEEWQSLPNYEFLYE